MLIIPIAALIFIGGSYVLAMRFLPGPVAMKAMPWMAGAALLGYVLTQFLIGAALVLVNIPSASLNLPLVVAISLVGSLAGAALVLRGFVVRHRRRKAEREAQSTTF